jgi:formylglycine-generating enzyme required for sulfatase activity
VVYCGYSCSGPQNVGSKSPKGDGKWGQSDLDGNIAEWTLDWWTNPYPMPCNNCAELTDASYRVFRGMESGTSNILMFRSAERAANDPGSHAAGIGARCARTSL